MIALRLCKVKIGLLTLALVAGFSASAEQGNADSYVDSCKKLRDAIASSRTDTQLLESPHVWSDLNEAAEKGCLSQHGAALLPAGLVQGYREHITGEIEQRTDAASVAAHMLTLCKARIGTFAHRSAPDDYQRFYVLLESSHQLSLYQSIPGWLAYVECIASAGFAADQIPEALSLVHTELKSSVKRSEQSQANFAERIGVMLISRVRLLDALALFRIGDSLTKTGITGEIALYWLALDAYSRADKEAAQRFLARLEQQKLSSDMTSRVPFLSALVDGTSLSAADTKLSSSQGAILLRDLQALQLARRAQ